MKFFCSQWLYDQAIKQGLDMSEWEVQKELPPSLPDLTFKVRQNIQPTRVRGHKAQWKTERNGRR